MKKIKIASDSIKLNGFGKSTEWGAVIGIAVDKMVSSSSVYDDDDVRKAIYEELKNRTLTVPDINSLPPQKIEAIDKLLKETTISLSSTDLKKLF